jgi:hypothetical protein
VPLQWCCHAPAGRLFIPTRRRFGWKLVSCKEYGGTTVPISVSRQTIRA